MKRTAPPGPRFAGRASSFPVRGAICAAHKKAMYEDTNPIPGLMRWQSDLLQAAQAEAAVIDPCVSMTYAVDECGWISVAFLTDTPIKWSRRHNLDRLESKVNIDFFDRCVRHGRFAPNGMGLCLECVSG